MAVGIPHGGIGIRCSWDLQAHRRAAPPATSRGHASVCRRFPGWGPGGRATIYAGPREAVGRGRGWDVAGATLPRGTVAHAGSLALAGKWQQGTKAACGGCRVSALPAGKTQGQARGPRARQRGPCQASPDPAAGQHVPAARWGWQAGGERGRAAGAAAGPSLPPPSASALSCGTRGPPGHPSPQARGRGVLASACSSRAGQDRAEPELGGLEGSQGENLAPAASCAHPCDVPTHSLCSVPVPIPCSVPKPEFSAGPEWLWG